MPTRRVLLDAFSKWLVLQALAPGDVLAGPVRPKVRDWFAQLRARAADLRTTKLAATAWQEEMERLAGDVPPDELCAAIDLDALAKKLTLPESGFDTVKPWLPLMEGAENLPYRLKVFGLRQGTAIAPHGHRHLASMHLILRGAFHVRHYERRGDDEANLVLAESIDRVEVPGGRSSVSDQRDNVHWLIATEGPAYTLDVIVADLGGAWGLDFVDIDGARAGANGTLIAPRITADQALRRYGHIERPSTIPLPLRGRGVTK